MARRLDITDLLTDFDPRRGRTGAGGMGKTTTAAATAAGRRTRP